jgi:hypothetical protein
MARTNPRRGVVGHRRSQITHRGAGPGRMTDGEHEVALMMLVRCKAMTRKPLRETNDGVK